MADSSTNPNQNPMAHNDAPQNPQGSVSPVGQDQDIQKAQSQLDQLMSQDSSTTNNQPQTEDFSKASTPQTTSPMAGASSEPPIAPILEEKQNVSPAQDSVSAESSSQQKNSQDLPGMAFPAGMDPNMEIPDTRTQEPKNVEKKEIDKKQDAPLQQANGTGGSKNPPQGPGKPHGSAFAFLGKIPPKFLIIFLVLLATVAGIWVYVNQYLVGSRADENELPMCTTADSDGDNGDSIMSDGGPFYESKIRHSYISTDGQTQFLRSCDFDYATGTESNCDNWFTQNVAQRISAGVGGLYQYSGYTNFFFQQGGEKKIQQSFIDKTGSVKFWRVCNFDDTVGWPVDSSCPASSPASWSNTTVTPAFTSQTAFIYNVPGGGQKLRLSYISTNGYTQAWTTCDWSDGKVISCSPADPASYNTVDLRTVVPVGGATANTLYSGYAVILWNQNGTDKIRQSFIDNAGTTKYVLTCDWVVDAQGVGVPESTCYQDANNWTKETIQMPPGQTAVGAYDTFLFNKKIGDNYIVCNSDADCPDGMVCGPDGYCICAPGKYDCDAYPGCESDQPCGLICPIDNASCENGQCVCDDGYVAVNGECVEEGIDTDLDLIPDDKDPDDDNDGIPDVEEGNGDPDGDGIPNSKDIDSDNDGIPDVIEAQSSPAKPFSNHVPNTCADSDGDGTLDMFENSDAPIDTDGDGDPDYLDIDSDDDGVPDDIEGHDANKDGIADNKKQNKDADKDGLDDGYDNYNATNAQDCEDWLDNLIGTDAPVQDTDGDGDEDWRDPDDDDDGTPTEEEDTNGNGDWSDDDDNSNGIPAYLDPEESGGGGGSKDTDKDLIPDDEDIDDDNDGIPDVDEGDGKRDTDGDGVPDSLDIDSDDDGITDVIESNASPAKPFDRHVPSTCGDEDGDGLLDVFEDNQSPIDTDGDGDPDYIDTDADGDGVEDEIEGHDDNQDGIADNEKTGSDSDKDGLDNGYDDYSAKGVEDCEDWLKNVIRTKAPVQNTDGEGDEDWRDPDDDGDGIPTEDEPPPGDEDGDGTPDYLDPDQGGGQCVETGGSCEADGDCCSDVCVNGTCLAQCVQEGGTCDSNGDCCTGMTCEGGTCTRGEVKQGVIPSILVKFQGVIPVERREPSEQPLDSEIMIVARDYNETTRADFYPLRTEQYTYAGVKNQVWIWEAKDVAFENLPAAEEFKIFIKGPKHLQKKICEDNPTEPPGPDGERQGGYVCTDGKITWDDMSDGLDFSQIYLLAGDLPFGADGGKQYDGQDGIVDSVDVTFLRNALKREQQERQTQDVTIVGDLSLDAIVDAQDYQLTIYSLGFKYDDIYLDDGTE